MTVSGVGLVGKPYIEIPLSKGKVAKVSPEDFALVADYSWHAAKNQAGNWYARAVKKKNGARHQIWMHRLILGLTDLSVVADHIDRDGLNNTRGNLRPCTAQQNSSRRVSNRKAANARGTFKQGNRWVALITANGKRRYLGMYATEQAASAAYYRAANDVFGAFAPSVSGVISLGHGSISTARARESAGTHRPGDSQ